MMGLAVVSIGGLDARRLAALLGHARIVRRRFGPEPGLANAGERNGSLMRRRRAAYEQRQAHHGQGPNAADYDPLFHFASPFVALTVR
ncbi:MAG: hypothetical protein ACTHNR_10430 [Trinickia sp.]